MGNRGRREPSPPAISHASYGQARHRRMDQCVAGARSGARLRRCPRPSLEVLAPLRSPRFRRRQAPLQSVAARIPSPREIGHVQARRPDRRHIPTRTGVRRLPRPAARRRLPILAREVSAKDSQQGVFGWLRTARHNAAQGPRDGGGRAVFGAFAVCSRHVCATVPSHQEAPAVGGAPGARPLACEGSTTGTIK